MASAASEKARLRRALREYRAGLTASEHSRLSLGITERLRKTPAIVHARVIHTFWPAANHKEVDFRPLILEWYASGKTVVMPVTAGCQPPALQHARFKGEAHMVQNRWGVHEPSQAEFVPLSDIEIIIAPALGADRAGHRIGYGKGFYDVFLKSADALVVAPLYHACLLPAVPAEPHDVPVSVIVTERETIEAQKFATSSERDRRENPSI